MGKVQVLEVDYSFQDIEAKLSVIVHYFGSQRVDSEGSVASLSEMLFVSEYGKCFYFFRVFDYCSLEIIVHWDIHKAVIRFNMYFQFRN